MDTWPQTFRIPDLTLRHARIGGLDAIYMQYPDGEGGHLHWYLGAGDDGVAFARPRTRGPLVPGRPQANLLEMEAHLARVSLMPADPVDAVRAFEETEWKDTGLDESLRWLEARGIPCPRIRVATSMTTRRPGSSGPPSCPWPPGWPDTGH